MRSISFCFPKHGTFWFGAASIIIIICVSGSYNELKILASTPIPFVLSYGIGLYLVTGIGAKDNFLARGLVSRTVLLSFIGIIISSVVFLILGVVHQFNFISIVLYMLFSIACYAIRSRGDLISIKRYTIGPIRLQSLLALLFLTVFMILFAMWIQPPSSFPDMAGWDVYTNMLTVRTILLENGISEINLRYLPVVHYFYAAPSILLDIDPFYLFWASIYFMFPVAGFSLYLLGTRVTHSVLTGVATGIFGITIGSSNETLGYIFPYPSTYGLILTTLANALILANWEKKVTVLYIILTALVYPFAIAANFIIIVASFLNPLRGASYYFGISLTIFSLIVILYIGGSLLVGQGAAANMSQDIIITGLLKAYSSGQGLALIFIGVFFLFYHKSIKKRSIIIMLITTITLILIVISGQLEAGYRLEEYTRPFLAVFIGFGVASTATEITRVLARRN